eukprot:752803-Lingulodinium_polyedra.AAC.1
MNIFRVWTEVVEACAVGYEDGEAEMGTAFGVLCGAEYGVYFPSYRAWGCASIAGMVGASWRPTLRSTTSILLR